MNEVLYKWATSILLKQSESKLYGTLTFQFANGKIVAAKIERSEKPPIDGS